MSPLSPARIRIFLIAIAWYATWLAACMYSSLNLPPVETALYFSWFFVSVTACLLFSLRVDVQRYIAMLVGFLVAVFCFSEGIVYLFGFRVGAAVFLGLLAGTQGALVGAFVVAIARGIKSKGRKGCVMVQRVLIAEMTETDATHEGDGKREKKSIT